MRALLTLPFLVACGGGVQARLTLEAADGSSIDLAVDDPDTFHQFGFVDARDEATPATMSLTFLEGQPGAYSTSSNIRLPDDRPASGNVVIDVDPEWNGSRQHPFVTRLRLLEGTYTLGTDGSALEVVDGELVAWSQGCVSAGGVGSAQECGATHALDGGSVTMALAGPSASERFTADLCPPELVERWYTGGEVTLSASRLDLGEDSLACTETQSGSMVCGADARGLEADGCDDWRVTWMAFPNATQGNPPLRVLMGGGADCGETYRTCRSEWASTGFSW